MSVPYLDVTRQDRCFDEELEASIMQPVCPQGFRVATPNPRFDFSGKAHGFSEVIGRAAQLCCAANSACKVSWGSTLERTRA